MGGADSSNYYTEVVLMSWNRADRAVAIRSLPELPVPMAYMGALLLDGAVDIAGGEESTEKGYATNAFYRLDLGKDGARDWQWEKLPSWNGPGRVMPVVAAQNNGKDDGLYLFSGRQGAEEGEELLFDAHVFDTHTNQWRQLQDVRLGDRKSVV